jgi:hypothetical protein
MAIDKKVRRIRADLNRGKRVTVPAWILETGKPGPRLLLTAAQHGNEVQGVEVIRRFVDLASAKLKRGSVVAVPFTNLPAVRDRRPHINMKPEQPYGDARGHNMNRTWAERKGGNDTSRLSTAVYDAFGEDATHVFDIHCWEKNNAPAVLIRERPNLRETAARLGHRFVDVRPPSDFTIGGMFNAMDRVGVTYECAGQYLVDEEQVRWCLRVATNLARIIGLLPGRVAKGFDPVLFDDAVDVRTLTAPRTGLFVGRDYKVCDRVEKGDILGHIISDTNLDVVEIEAPVSGYLRAYGASRANCDVALPGQHPYCSKGDRVAAISTPKS